MNNDLYAAPTVDLQIDGAAITGSLTFLIQSTQSGLFGLLPTNYDLALVSTPVTIAIFAALLLLILAFVYLMVCAAIKRLHNCAHNGWWSLPLFVVILIPPIRPIGLLGYLYLMCFPGYKHENRFGDQRPTNGWEKTLGIISIVLMVSLITLAILGMILGFSGI